MRSLPSSWLAFERCALCVVVSQRGAAAGQEETVLKIRLKTGGVSAAVPKENKKKRRRASTEVCLCLCAGKVLVNMFVERYWLVVFIDKIHEYLDGLSICEHSASVVTAAVEQKKRSSACACLSLCAGAVICFDPHRAGGMFCACAPRIVQVPGPFCSFSAMLM